MPERCSICAVAHERVDCGDVPADGGRRLAQFVGVLVDDDSAVVDDEHVLEQIAHLVDQVGREDDGARMLGIVLEEPVVENLPGHGIQTEVWLVEEGQRRPRSESDDHANRRQLTSGELLDLAVHRQPEVFDEPLGKLRIPVREEPGRGSEYVRGLKFSG